MASKGVKVAVAARAGASRLLSRLKVNQHIQDSTKQTVNVEGSIAAALFWVILLITILGVFNALDLEIASNPLQALANQIFGYMPRLLAGTVLVIIAWLLAMVLRSIATKVLEKTTWDEKLTASAGSRCAHAVVSAAIERSAARNEAGRSMVRLLRIRCERGGAPGSGGRGPWRTWRRWRRRLPR